MHARLSRNFREDLVRVYATLRPVAPSAAFLSDLKQVHASLPSASDENLLLLADCFQKWRETTRQFVTAHLNELTDDDPLLCPISLFRTMDAGRLEVAHTRTLAWLLDPRKDEEHGFGSTLMAALLERLAERDRFDHLDVEKVVSEHPLEATGGEGRLDILSTGESRRAGDRSRWMLIIEAKIDAWEGEAQLNRYDEWIDAHAAGCETYRVFLTPEGRPPDNGSDEWKALSFLQLVQTFHKVYRNLRAAPGFQFLRLYLAGVLQDICGFPRKVTPEAPDPFAIASYLQNFRKSRPEHPHHGDSR
jgi:hypothetical protein